jgi:hypothetical protein
MTRDTKNRLIVFLVMVVVILVIARTVNHAPPDETPRERAHRLCGECGLDRDRIEQLIGSAANSTLDRNDMIWLCEAMFEPEDDQRGLCTPCVEAVLDTAETE